MDNWRKAIVFYLVFSCLCGIYGVVEYVSLLDKYTFAEYPFVWMIGAIFLILFIGIGVSAYSLLRTNRYTKATITLQIIQLVGFCIAGYKYEFSAGTSLKWLYQGNRLEMIFKPITAEFAAGMNLPAEFLYVNLFPLLIIYLITKFFAPNYISDEIVSSV